MSYVISRLVQSNDTDGWGEKKNRKVALNAQGFNCVYKNAILPDF